MMADSRWDRSSSKTCEHEGCGAAAEYDSPRLLCAWHW